MVYAESMPEVITYEGEGRIERFERLKLEPEFPNEVFRRLSEGETLKAIALEHGLPKGRFVQWYVTVHEKLYDAALKVRAADLALEALEISDGGAVEEVGRDKLRVDTRLKLAGKWDRARYGEAVKVDVSRPAPEDDKVVSFAAALIERISERRGERKEKVIEPEEGLQGEL